MLTTGDVQRELVAILPAFGSRLSAGGSVFVDSAGSYTLHGLFAELSHHVRQQFTDIDEPSRKRLFQFVEECAARDPDAARGVGNAACTCFIENLTNEEVSGAVRPYLGPETGAYFDACQSRES
jgi:hypothetical protein